MTTGTEIKELRKAARWSQEALARNLTQAGYKASTPTIRNWESGKHPPSDEVMDVVRQLVAEEQKRREVRRAAATGQAKDNGVLVGVPLNPQLTEIKAELAEIRRIWSEINTSLRAILERLPEVPRKADLHRKRAG